MEQCRAHGSRPSVIKDCRIESEKERLQGGCSPLPFRACFNDLQATAEIVVLDIKE